MGVALVPIVWMRIPKNTQVRTCSVYTPSINDVPQIFITKNNPPAPAKGSAFGAPVS